MFKKTNVLCITLGLMLIFNIKINAMQEGYKINNEETPLKTKTISFQTQKEIFSKCNEYIYRLFQELNKDERLDWYMLNDIIKLIKLINSETEYLENLEEKQNTTQPNKNQLILLIQYNKIFEEIDKKIKRYINNLKKNLNNIKDYQSYIDFDFSMSDEEKEEESKDEEDKRLKEKEKTIAIYKTILENILNAINFSYIPILENLVKLIEKTFVDLLKNMPKIYEIKSSIENNIKINKENLEKLKLKIVNFKKNLNKID